jgi:putative membrane protein
VLHYLLHRWHAATVSVLTGFMIGALRKVWPWKEVLETSVIRGKIHVLREQNVLPGGVDGEVFLAIGLALAGAMVVLLLDRLSRGGKRA